MFCSEHVSFGSRAAAEYVRTMAKSTQAWLNDFDLAVKIDECIMRVEKLGSKVEEAHKESRQEDCCQTSNQSTKKPKTHNQQMEDDFMECMVKSGFWPT